ncbi:MAG TPA: hypothetical protein VIH40_13525 [Xanthobacteraceae bacterium]
MGKGVNLPAIYRPPAKGGGDMVGELLDIARAAPEHRGVLLRIAAELQARADSPTVEPLGGHRQRRKGRRRGIRRRREAALESSRAVAPAGKPKPVPAAARSDPASVTSVHGLTIDRTLEAESVSFAGHSMEVTAGQAHLALLLARAFGTPIDRGFLAEKLFPNQSQQSRETSLVAVSGKLKAALAGIRLDVHTVRGVGIVLRELEAQ